MKKNVIVIGPNPDLFGGISQYVSGILSSSLKEKYNLIHCEVGIGKEGKPGLISALMRMFKQLYSMYLILINKKIDLVHIHTASRRSFWRYFTFIFLLKIMDTKIVLHMHGAKFKEFYSGHSFIGKYIICSIIEICDSMILLSKVWHSFFDKIVPSVVKDVIEPTVEMAQENFVNLDKASKLRDNTNIVKVLYFGGLSERKGLKVIIEASRFLRNKNKISLIIAGAVQNSEISLVRDLINNSKDLGDRFKIKYNVSKEEKTDLFLESHIYILPSYAEGLPATLIEAMSFQLPVITTPVGSIPEIINKENGILVKPGDSKGLADAIVNLSENPVLRKKMGSSNRFKAINNYNYLKMFKNIASVYQKQILKK